MANQAVSPFNMSQSDISNVYMGANNVQLIDYELNLLQRPGCVANGPNTCCGMQLENLQVQILASASIANVTIGGKPANFSTAPWNEAGQEQYAGLLIEGLDWGVEDLPQGGISIIITLKVRHRGGWRGRAGANQNPQPLLLASL